MCKRILFIFLFLPLVMLAQQPPHPGGPPTGHPVGWADTIQAPPLVFGMYNRHECKNMILTAGLIFAAGMLDGTAEALKFHYPNFKNKFPNCNDQFFNPALSWKNKYKNADPLQGEKYFLSTRALVGSTDAYHLARTGRNMLIISAVTFHLGQPGRPWYKYLTEIAVNYLAYTAGFSLTYDLYFNNKRP
jgi:hypothetical protein